MVENTSSSAVWTTDSTIKFSLSSPPRGGGNCPDCPPLAAPLIHPAGIWQYLCRSSNFLIGSNLPTFFRSPHWLCQYRYLCKSTIFISALNHSTYLDPPHRSALQAYVTIHADPQFLNQPRRTSRAYFSDPPRIFYLHLGTSINHAPSTPAETYKPRTGHTSPKV